MASVDDGRQAAGPTLAHAVAHKGAIMKTHGLQKKLVLALASVVLGVGCVGEDGSFGEGEGEDIETVTSPVTVYPSSLTGNKQYGAMWTWKTHGANVVPLGNANTTSCFLSSVWGSLKGTDTVGISKVDGYWVLGGTGSQSSPAADAFCILDAPTGPTVSVTATNTKKMIPGASASAHTCFITRIRGDFASSSKLVSVEQVGTGWSLKAEGGVEATAACTLRPPLPIEAVWSGTGAVTLYGDLSDPNNNKAINTTTNRKYFCSLTRIEGILNNLDGWVGTFNEPAPTGGWQWYLGGKKNALNLGFTTKTYPLAGSARCVQ